MFGDREVGSIGAQGPPGSPGAQGPKGGKGDPGKSELDAFGKWVPNLALDGFRKEEVGCFLLTDPNADVKRERKKGITEWYSHSPTKMNDAYSHVTFMYIYIPKSAQYHFFCIETSITYPQKHLEVPQKEKQLISSTESTAKQGKVFT